MVGDIAAPRVIIVDGASFRGRIDMGEVDVGGGEPRRAQAQVQSRPSAPAVRAAPRPALAAPRPAPVSRAVVEEKPAPAPVRPAVPPAPVAMGAVKRKVIVKTKK
jgi:hypothetical protein